MGELVRTFGSPIPKITYMSNAKCLCWDIPNKFGFHAMFSMVIAVKGKTFFGRSLLYFLTIAPGPVTLEFNCHLMAKGHQGGVEFLSWMLLTPYSDERPLDAWFMRIILFIVLFETILHSNC